MKPFEKPKNNYFIRALVDIDTERVDETSFLKNDMIDEVSLLQMLRHARFFVIEKWIDCNINFPILKAPFTSVFRCEPLVFARDILSSQARSLMLIWASLIRMKRDNCSENARGINPFSLKGILSRMLGQIASREEFSGIPARCCVTRMTRRKCRCTAVEAREKGCVHSTKRLTKGIADCVAHPYRDFWGVCFHSRSAG